LNHKLEVDNITKSIGKVDILHGISLNIKSGEVIGLLGPNGAGKTTSFYIICGLVPPTKGTITFDGNDITHLPLHKRALKGIGYLPQESSIFKDLSVEDNLMLAAEISIDDKKERYKKIEELLELFNIEPIRQRLGV
jgi:lipopolysaccharide export system ATP-binding protein